MDIGGKKSKKRGGRKMFKVQKITKRWLLRSFLIIVAALILIEALVIVITKNSYYNQSKQLVKTRASVIQTALDSYAADTDTNFNEQVRLLVENFDEREKMELIVIAQNGKPILSSSGFQPSLSGILPDLTYALSSDSKMGECFEKGIGGENIFCVSIISPTQSADLFSLRLMASFEPTDRRIFNLSLIYIAIGLAILIFILLSNLVFLNSISRPVAEATKTARKIAAGDFDVRIDTKYKDEMGDLCEIINYMADELSQSENMKNEFISSVSHELRTPLTAIKGWSETIADDENCTKSMRQKGLRVIGSETDRLSSIVEDLLDFSKIQGGRFSIKMEKVDILAELTEAVIAFSDKAKREGIILEYDEPQMVSAVLGDRNRIRQVFVNILDNAIKYSESGGRVKVSVLEEYSVISVSVEDEGCGISPEDLPKIKKKFFKANYTKRGSGIGLAVVDEIVSLLGGTLEIKSQLSVGTCVTVSLPTVKEKEQIDE